MDDVPSTFRPWGRVVLVCCALLPALAAWAETERIPVPRPLGSQREISSLALEQYSVNLREVPPVGTIPARFGFVNGGKQLLKITKFEPSCGCLAPRLTLGQETFAPGESGEFVVGVKTATEKPGPKEFSVVVHYDDGQPRQQLVTFRLIVPDRKVTISPSQLMFYQLKGEAGKQQLTLTDQRGKNLNITDVSTSSSHVSVEIGERRISRDGTVEVPLEVHVPAGIPSGREITSLIIQTDDPDYPKIQVPVMLEGPWQPNRPTVRSVGPPEEPSTRIRDAQVQPASGTR